MNLLTTALFDRLVYAKGLQGTLTARITRNSLIAEQRLIDEAEKRRDFSAIELHKKLIRRLLQTLDLMS